MYAVLLAVVGAFFLLFFNRFAALRSGDGEYTAGVAFLHGVMPYRDYFTTAPPLNLLKSAMLLKVFGTALIVSRAAAVVERLVIAAVLFRWLRQMFGRVPSLIGSAVTLIVSAGDRTDPLASYNHDAILFAMLSGLLASLVLERRAGSWREWGVPVASGCAAGLAILTKQTVGLGSACTVFGVVAVLLWKDAAQRLMWRWVGAFAAGALLPLGAAAIVLERMHVLRAFLEMLFVKGPAAKAAHASEFLVRELRVGWDNFGWLVLGSFALALSWRAIGRWVHAARVEAVQGQERDEVSGETRAAVWVLLAGAGVFGLAELLRGVPSLHDFSKSAVYFTELALSLLLIRFGPGMFRGRTSPRERQVLLFCAVAWAIAFTLSLSWPAFEAMVLPGFGFLVAALLEGARRKWLPWVYAALAFLVLMQTREKLDLPFGFDYQEEQPVRVAYARSVQPQLRGMRLPGETVRFLDETVATIQARTREGESIFVYPEIGLLYALSSRPYPTLSGSHNIDVLNDAFAAEEADRLRSARPAVIVYYRLTEQQQRDAERLWRGGRPSGQRLLVQAVEELVAGYREEGRYRLKAGDPEIVVYVRP